MKKELTAEDHLRSVRADIIRLGYRSWPEFLSAYDAVLTSEKKYADAYWKVVDDRRTQTQAIRQLSAFGNAEIDRNGAFTIHKKAFEKA